MVQLPAILCNWTWHRRLGLFKEYEDPDTKQKSSDPSTETISKELVDLSIFGNKLNGNITTTDQRVRSHRITSGSFANEPTGQKRGIVIISAAGNDPERHIGGFSYVLTGNFADGILTGYWTGYDPDENRIVTCPYILTRDEDFYKHNNDVWLRQKCAPPPQ